MSLLRIVTRKLFGNPGTGRVPFWDPKNENYRIEAVLPARSLALADAPPRKHKLRRYRQWRWYDQGRKPFCTSYGTYSCMAADPVRQPQRGAHLGDPDVFFAEIQAIDRVEGRFYPEGATGLAAMKAAVARGWFGEYRWTTDPDVALITIEDVSPIMCGTNMYSSMFDRDAEGIIRITPTAIVAGGHWFCVGAVDYRRSLVRIQQTWGTGVQWLPIDDLARLMREDAEVCLARELVVAAPLAAPSAALFAAEDEDDGN